jgi:hypothetical protein
MYSTEMSVITQNQMSVYAQYVRTLIFSSIKLKFLEPETNTSMICSNSTNLDTSLLLMPSKVHIWIDSSAVLKLQQEFPT